MADKNAANYKKGLCCGCQSVVPVQPSTLAVEECLDKGIEEWELEQTYGNSIRYIVIDHTFYGEHCDGSGQIPQVVIKD